MRINVAIGAVALTLASSVLAGCGGGGGGSSSGASGNYCSDLKADKAYFSSFSGSNPDLSNLGDVFTRMHTLAGEAPSNIAPEWKTLDGALTTLQQALASAGIQPSDLASMANGQVPQGADLSKLQALLPKLQALDSTAVSDAGDKITADAKASCGVDLTSD